jgi:hypothetical protein
VPLSSYVPYISCTVLCMYGRVLCMYVRMYVCLCVFVAEHLKVTKL